MQSRLVALAIVLAGISACSRQASPPVAGGAASPGRESDRPGTVRVTAHGQVFHMPVARFDNRTDLTTFIREDPARWPADKVAAIHAELKRALTALAGGAR